MVELISQYLKTHRRLNIPTVGAFMVKDSHGEIIFSELLKRDDGVLRSLLAERGMRDIEVAAAIDRFVFELKHETDSVGSEFVMRGLGVLRREQSGRLLFVVEPEQAEEAVEPEVAEVAEVAEQAADAEQSKQTEETNSQEYRAEEESAESTESVEEEVATQPEEEGAEKPQIIEIVEVELESSEAKAQSTTAAAEAVEESTPRYTAERVKDLYTTPKTFRDKDPTLGDLTYSKRQKSLAGYTYVQNGAQRRGIDKVLLFGIIAAIIAIAVIGYGYYVGHVVNDGPGADTSDPKKSVQVESVEGGAVEPSTDKSGEE